MTYNNQSRATISEMSALVKPIAGKITVIDIIGPAPLTGGSANEATIAAKL